MVKTKTCPICRKEFAGKAALRQHMTTKHQVAQQQPVARAKRAAPRVMRNSGRGALGSSARVETGCELLDVASIPAASVVGTRLFSYALNPRSMSGSRLASLAVLWQRWRPHSLALEVTPAASYTTSGSYLVGWAADPRYDMGAGVEGVRAVMALQVSRQAHISQPVVISIPSETVQRWLYVDPSEAEDATHGVVVGLLAAPIGNLTATSAVSLTIKLRWTIAFEGQTLPRMSEFGTIYAEDDYTPYFTDSVSDWAGGDRLTLKHKEGGSVVYFPKIHSGVVYKLDPGAQLKYYTSATATAKIAYGVKILNYYTLAMAVFADLDDAKAYASTGDTEKCLKYYKAGDWVVPNNPAWSFKSSSAESVSVSVPPPTPHSSLEEQVSQLTSMVARLSEQVDRLTVAGDSDFQILQPPTPPS